MISGSRVLALIAARGGSRGVPRKNLRIAGGKPLLAWTAAAARASRYVDRVVTSTDDEEIREEALRCGSEVPFLRPARLATDEATSVDVALDALGRLPGFDYLVLLQPTSPLRTADDIDRAIELCRASGAPSCVTVRRAAESPWWMYTLADGKRLEPVVAGARATRRQDLPAAYLLNGAVYVAETSALLAHRTFVMSGTVALEMPDERSIDIDTESDLALADQRLQSL
jgi:N-acylneuraminate cytidylyltransferase